MASITSTGSSCESQPFQFVFSNNKGTRLLSKDMAGIPILNSAGVPFAPLLVPESNVVIKISAFVTTFNMSKVLDFTDAVNDKVYVVGGSPVQSAVVTASSNTVQLTAASSTNGFYNGGYVSIISGLGENQTRIILGWDGGTLTATTTQNWTIAPDNTSIAIISQAGSVTFGTGTLRCTDYAARFDQNTCSSTYNCWQLNITLEYKFDGWVPLLLPDCGMIEIKQILPATTSDVASATNNTVTLSTGSNTDDFYNGGTITLTTGTGQGETGTILDWNGATKTATMTQNWVTNPDNTSVANITQGPSPIPQTNCGINVVSATSNTIELDNNGSTTDGFYDGGTISIVAGTGQGQTGIIANWDGTTNTATMTLTWTTIPDITSVVKIAQAGVTFDYKVITDLYGRPVNEPVLLDGCGRELTVGGTPVYISLQPFRKKDFNQLI
jgi:hypothetical protein